MCLWLERLIQFQPTTTEYQEVRKESLFTDYWRKCLRPCSLKETLRAPLFRFMCRVFKMKMTELFDRQLACEHSAWAQSDTALLAFPACSRSAVCRQDRQTDRQTVLLLQPSPHTRAVNTYATMGVFASSLLLLTHSCHLNLKPQSKAWNEAAARSKQPTHCNECRAMQTNMQCKHLNIVPQKNGCFLFFHWRFAIMSRF